MRTRRSRALHKACAKSWSCWIVSSSALGPEASDKSQALRAQLSQLRQKSNRPRLPGVEGDVAEGQATKAIRQAAPHIRASVISSDRRAVQTLGFLPESLPHGLHWVWCEMTRGDDASRLRSSFTTHRAVHQHYFRCNETATCLAKQREEMNKKTETSDSVSRHKVALRNSQTH